MNELYWLIGRKSYVLKSKCNNPNEYLSNYLSYCFGNSILFSRENINYMKKFYLAFPIYIKKYNVLSWNHFKILLGVNNRVIRNFYLNIVLFCNSNTVELEQLISSCVYYRI